MKYKRGKVKPLKPGTKESLLEEDHPHYKLITQSERWDGKKGKFVVELVEGSRYLSIHDQFEYNPFGVTLDKLHDASRVEIVSIIPR